MTPGLTKFSEFVRNASPKEKERVFLQVIDAAINRQKQCLKLDCTIKRS